ncbi:hypothetical protein E8E11_006568 [Didymella keratinophila]|nr:hypothetical protein E8E11_006568 [Didymella keratinophila]
MGHVYNHPDIPEYDTPPLFGPDAWRNEPFDAAERQPIYAYVNVWIEEQQKKQLVAKLPVNFKRLLLGEDGHMSIVENVQNEPSAVTKSITVQPIDDSHENEDVEAFEAGQVQINESQSHEKSHDYDTRERGTAEVKPGKSTVTRREPYELKGGSTEELQMDEPVAERQQEELLVKLPVNWDRLVFGEDGVVSIMRGAQLGAFPTSDDDIQIHDAVQASEVPQEVEAHQATDKLQDTDLLGSVDCIQMPVVVQPIHATQDGGAMQAKDTPHATGTIRADERAQVGEAGQGHDVHMAEAVEKVRSGRTAQWQCRSPRARRESICDAL